jgi:hypothetical protein
MNSETRLLTVLGLVVSVAVAGIAIALVTQNQEADASKAFGQCNKNANKSNHDAGVKGKAGADARKAKCKSLKPVKGNDTGTD